MIKIFNKDRGDGYYNAIELAWLFLLSELHEYLSIFGAYDLVHQVYNIRRLLWVVFFTIFVIIMSLTFLVTCTVYLANTFGVI